MTAVHKLCTKCLMPAHYPGISFDMKGVCTQCRNFKKIELPGEDLLLKTLKSKKGVKYDCVVGISGGKDSCYIAYLAKERFKLRVLAVFYDSPFYCDLARRNLKKVCDTLDIDLLIIKSKNNLEYNLLRNHLISVAGSGMSWGQCIFCHYGIDAILYNIAKEKDIPFILSGFTKHERMDSMYRTKMVKKLVNHDFWRFFYYQAKALCLLIEQRRQFRLPGNSIFSVYKRVKVPCDGPEILKVFDYIGWNYQEIEEVLTEKVGWTKPDAPISWSYDCILESLLGYSYKKELGISTVGIYLSNLIRSGQIEREQALDIMEKCENEELLKCKIEYVFDYLRIPKPVQKKFFSTV